MCLSVLVCSLLLLPVLAADTVTITPVWIHDGDTFQAHLINKAFLNCRIWGIDAPELDQPWGKVAKSALIELIHQRKIKIVRHSESYGRTVVTIHLSGRDIALDLLKMGLAWHDPKYSPDCKDYALAQDYARKNRIGLWSDKNPVPPWEWRKKRYVRPLYHRPPSQLPAPSISLSAVRHHSAFRAVHFVHHVHIVQSVHQSAFQLRSKNHGPA